MEKVRLTIDCGALGICPSCDKQADRIVSLVRELVGELRYDVANEVMSGKPNMKNVGWNACRTEILSRLEDK